MDENKMKEEWRQMCNDSHSRDDINYRIIEHERKTALVRLSDRYKRFIFLGFVMMLMSLTFICAHEGHQIIPREAGIYMFFYFLLCVILDLKLYCMIKKINPIRMTTREVIQSSYKARKFHLLCIPILLPLAIGYVILVVWNVRATPALLWGLWFGLVFGLAVGVYQLSQVLADYKSLTLDEE